MAPAVKAILTKRADAVKAVAKMRSLELEIKEIEEEHGLKAKRDEVQRLKHNLIGYMQRENKSRLDADVGYLTLVQPTGKSWISTKEEIPKNAPRGQYKSLRAILGKDLWLRVTKRVVNPDALQELVDEGEVTEDELAPAMMEKPHGAYVRFYEGK